MARTIMRLKLVRLREPRVPAAVRVLESQRRIRRQCECELESLDLARTTRHNRTNRTNFSYTSPNIRWSKSLAHELTAAMPTLSAAPQVSSAVSPLQSSVSDKPCVCDQQAQYCFRVDGAQRNCVERVECCTLAGIAFAPYSSFMRSRANPLVSRLGIAA